MIEARRWQLYVGDWNVATLLVSLLLSSKNRESTWASSSVSHKAAQGPAEDMQREADYTASSLRTTTQRTFHTAQFIPNKQWKIKFRP
jgi:hypothetical protein